MYWQSGGMCYYITGNVVKGSDCSGFICMKLAWFLIQEGGLPERVHPSEKDGMYVLAEYWRVLLHYLLTVLTEVLGTPDISSN